jgi:hypothetical protein
VRLHHLLGLAAATALSLLAMIGFAYAERSAEESCTDDAMIVFDPCRAIAARE